MATVTKTTVETSIGQYTYKAELDGNQITLYRDGVPAGNATWTGQSIENFPHVLSEDAHDALNAAIQKNLSKAWRANTSVNELDKTTEAENPQGHRKTQDAANQGQRGNELSPKPARQGEAEVGLGGPGHDPRTGELGGQAISPERRAVPNGMEIDQQKQRHR